MTEPTAPADSPKGDPWQAFGYVVAGVVLYGAAGWGLDRWLGTKGLVAVGIIFGAALGIFMTWRRFEQIADAADRAAASGKRAVSSTDNDSKERP